MKNRPLREIIRAYEVGDHISDNEMLELRDTYHELASLTANFLRFTHTHVEAILELNKLNGFLRARGKHQCTFEANSPDFTSEVVDTEWYWVPRRLLRH